MQFIITDSTHFVCKIHSGRGWRVFSQVRRTHIVPGFVLSLQQLFSAQPINGPTFGSRHELGTWILWHARLRPLFERGNQSVLSKILGESDITDNQRNARNDPCGLNPPGRLDSSMSIGFAHSSHHKFIEWLLQIGLVFISGCYVS